MISLVDVTDEKAVEAFCASGLQEFSRLDFAANVAGYGHPAKPSTEISIAEFDKTFDVNLKGVGGHYNLLSGRITYVSRCFYVKEPSCVKW